MTGIPSSEQPKHVANFNDAANFTIERDGGARRRANVGSRTPSHAIHQSRSIEPFLLSF